MELIKGDTPQKELNSYRTRRTKLFAQDGRSRAISNFKLTNNINEVNAAIVFTAYETP